MSASETTPARTRLALALIVVMSLVAAFGIVFVRAPVASAAPTGNCSGVAYSQFTFNFVNGTTISGNNCPGSDYEFKDKNGNRKKNEAWFPGTGGSADYPNGPGMQVHVSCSDVFTDGWSDNADRGPSQTKDPNWQIANYTIKKYSSDGDLNKTCGEVFVTTTTTTAPTTTTTTAPTTTTTTAPTTTTTTAPTTTTTTAPTTTTTTAPTTTTTTAPTTTTTTAPTTTTTTAPTTTTTTAPTTTTTTAPTTTTTTAPTTTTTEQVTTTTEPPATTTSLAATTTTEPPATTTSLAATTTAVEVKGTEVLPFTGMDSDMMALLALVLAASGVLLLVATRKAED